jgi:hypothetical protein
MPYHENSSEAQGLLPSLLILQILINTPLWWRYNVTMPPESTNADDVKYRGMYKMDNEWDIYETLLKFHPSILKYLIPHHSDHDWVTCSKKHYFILTQLTRPRCLRYLMIMICTTVLLPSWWYSRMKILSNIPPHGKHTISYKSNSLKKIHYTLKQLLPHRLYIEALLHGESSIPFEFYSH